MAVSNLDSTPTYGESKLSRLFRHPCDGVSSDVLVYSVIHQVQTIQAAILDYRCNEQEKERLLRMSSLARRSDADT